MFKINLAILSQLVYKIIDTSPKSLLFIFAFVNRLNVAKEKISQTIKIKVKHVSRNNFNK